MSESEYEVFSSCEHNIPGRIQAVLAYLHYAQERRYPRPQFEGQTPEAVELIGPEQVCYEAALELLTRYFRGEVQFADSVFVPCDDDGGDEEKEPEKVPAKP